MKSELPQAPVAIAKSAQVVIRTPAPQPAQAVGGNVGSYYPGWTNPVQEYCVDACQRWLLTLDALRERGNNYLEQKKLISPAVLNAP
jgi:hypothetical protein